MPLSAAPTAPRFEHRTDARARARPRDGDARACPGRSRAPTPDWRADRYEVEVTATGTAVVRRRLRGRAGARPVAGAAAGAPASAAEVRVRVAHGDDLERVEPEPATVEAGLLDPADWTARFVTPAEVGRLGRPGAGAHRDARGARAGRSARLYATAHGIYAAARQRPAHRRHRARARLDVLRAPAPLPRLRRDGLVCPGANVLDVLLGNGWYRGRLGYPGERALYGDRLALLAQLEVTTADGTVHVLATDGSWTRARERGRRPTTSTTARRPTCAGARGDRPHPGCRGAPRRTCPSSSPRTARRSGRPGSSRRSGCGPPRRAARSSTSGRTPSAGSACVSRGLPAGTEVVVRHAEVLEDEELGTRPLRAGEGHRHLRRRRSARRSSSRP